MRLSRCVLLLVSLLALSSPFLQAQQEGSELGRKEKLARIRKLGHRKADAIPALEAYSKDPDTTVREEAVRAIVRVGGPDSVTPLITATHDNAASVQLLSLNGLVNFYLPGYVPLGLTAPMTKGVRSAKSVMNSRDDQVIDSGTVVRTDVGEAVRDLISRGNSQDVRRSAARAAGILRANVTIPALAGAIRAHDNTLVSESLIALQKIKPKADLPALRSATRDLDEKTQILALETVGVVQSVSSAPDIRQILKDARNIRVERAALSALSMLGQAEDRPVFLKYSESTDVALQSSALEGLGRTREPEDVNLLEKAFNETGADWRVHLAAAFALVSEGRLEKASFSPLPYLMETLSMRSHSDTAAAYLAELARRADVREALLPMIQQSNRDAKLAICPVLGENGTADVQPVLQELTRDPSAEVATAASKALRTLKARLSPETGLSGLSLPKTSASYLAFFCFC